MHVGIFSHLILHVSLKLKFFRGIGLLVKLSIAALFFLPLIVDGTVQLFSTYESTNLLRGLTGFFFGFGAYVPFYQKN